MTTRVFGALVCAGLLAASAGAQEPPPLTYRAALDRAMARNLGLAAARRQRAIREALVRAAGQIPNPDFSATFSRDTPHEALLFDFPVELGGKRARRIDLAREELSLADTDVRTELVALRRNLRQGFYGLLAADERVRTAEAVVAIARRIREVAQARFDAGAAPRLDVLQADLGVARAEADLELARSGRAVAQAGLNAVLNQAPDQALAVGGDLAEGPPPLTFARAVELATASNVELLAVDRELAIEQRRTSLLRAERVPTPILSAGGLFNAPPEFGAGAQAGVTVAIPLFNRNQGEIAASLATADQLRARAAATHRTIESGVYGAVARVDATRHQAELYRDRLIPTAVSLEDLAEESYRLGRNSVLAVLDAQRSLRDVRREYLQALSDFQAAVADLEEIIGAPIE